MHSWITVAMRNVHHEPSNRVEKDIRNKFEICESRNQLRAPKTSRVQRLLAKLIFSRYAHFAMNRRQNVAAQNLHSFGWSTEYVTSHHANVRPLK